MNNLTLTTLEPQRAQNSKKVPGVPFKSKKELGGELDPRINRGGRPKILKEESAKWLAMKDENGKTNAAKMVEAMGELAQQKFPHSVSAFKELRQTSEGIDDENKGAFNIGQMNMVLMQVLQKAAKEAIVEGEFEKLGEEKGN